ncbi:GntR family transcriptional regulator [Dactylosporangium sp. NPDC000555]|uniref:GntR family transcriptional regulator n=1 Tax=Dactylosporangium sp. NPDC000555 TaxID=3154260 RepID=UPI003327248E
MSETGNQPLYARLADTLRDLITSGQYAPGSLLPPEPALGNRHHVGHTTVRRALRQLAREGFIETRRGAPARVRPQQGRTPVTLAAGERLTARMPTRLEARRLRIPPGVALLEINHAGGGLTVLRADQHTIAG